MTAIARIMNHFQGEALLFAWRRDGGHQSSEGAMKVFFPSRLSVLRAARLAGALLASAVTVGCKGGGNSPPPVTGDDGCNPLDPIPRRIWRLSVNQYGTSVRASLGLSSAPDV